MSITDDLNRQHEEILDVVKAVSTLLKPEEVTAKAQEIRSLLANLFGKLSVHLTTEDKVLYPTLLKSTDEAVKTTAQKFIDQMGGIGEAIKGYKETWGTTEKISSSPDSFIKDTQGIFAALGERVDKENKELYPLL